MVINHTVLLMNDGTIKVCGDNYHGQLGLNDLGYNKQYLPTYQIYQELNKYHVVSTHIMLLMNDGTIKACGYKL